MLCGLLFQLGLKFVYPAFFFLAFSFQSLNILHQVSYLPDVGPGPVESASRVLRLVRRGPDVALGSLLHLFVPEQTLLAA